MIIDLKNFTPLPVLSMAIVIVHVVLNFTVYSSLQLVSYAVWGLSILCFLLMALLYAHEAKMTLYGLTWSIYFFLLLLSTLLHGTSLKVFAYTMVDCLLFLFLLSYFRHSLKSLIVTCNIIFSLAIFGNLILMILFPGWMFSADNTADSFILGGNHNQIGGRLLCGIATGLLCMKFDKRWVINVIFLFIASFATLILVGSMTALSGLLILMVSCLIPVLRLQKVGLIFFFLFYVLFQVFVCFNGEGLHNSETARYIIVDLLGKDITFTGRTALWEAASKVFSSSPIIGYGCVDTQWYYANMTSQAIGPHNFVWGQLINGGVLLLGIFIISCSIAVHKIFDVFDRYACLLLISATTLLFMMLMEVYPIFFILYLLTLTFYYPALHEQSQTCKKQKAHE